LTGHKPFYRELRQAIAEVAIEARGTDLLAEMVGKLAQTPEIKQLAGK
jgi:hypothetical protein